MVHQQRPTTIIGNWKMHKTIAEARSFVSGLAVAQHGCRGGLAVPFTMIAAAAEAARGTAVMIGAQNVSTHSEGPYTGEISAKMLKDAGATFGIVGHSERRVIFHEDDEMVSQKIGQLMASGIRPLVCIGESLKQRQEGMTHDVLHAQLSESLKGLSPGDVEHLMIAYEPIWAIGTGDAATTESVQSAHEFCRKVIANGWGRDTAEHVLILYGGSVKPENAAELLGLKDVDGLLVGGASLSLETFNKILQARGIAPNI